jgi:hypothetical protein
MTIKLATAAGSTKERTQVQRKAFISIHPLKTHSDFPEVLEWPAIPGACKRIPEAASFYDIPRHGKVDDWFDQSGCD